MQDANKPAERVEIRQTVGYRRSYHRVPGFAEIHNISETGAFLKFADNIKEGEKVLIDLEVSGHRRTVSSTVIWCGRGGCGVQFIIKSERDQQIINDLIAVISEYNQLQKVVLHGIFGQLNASVDGNDYDEDDWGETG